MENSNERFEDKWKKAFDIAEEEPNSSIWQNLESKLAEKEVLLYKQKYFYLRRVAAALLMLLIPLVVFFVYKSGLRYEDQIIDNRTSDTSADNRNFPQSKEDIGAIPDNIASSKQLNKAGGLADQTSAYEKSKQKKGKGNSVQTILKTNSIGNTDGVDISKNNKARNTSDLNANKSDDIDKYIENSNDKVVSVNDVENSSLIGIDKSNIKDASADHSKNQKLTSSKTMVKRTNSEEINDVKSPSYSEEIPITSFEEGKKHTLQNSAKNTVDKTNSIFLISNYLRSKGPHLAYVQNPQRDLKFEENKLVLGVVPQKNQFRKWFAGLDFTPTYTNQNFERPSSNSKTSNSINSTSLAMDFNGSNRAMDVVDQLDVLIKPDFSFNSGLGIGYRLNKRLYIESGLKYTYNQSIVITNLLYANRYNSSQSLVFNKVLKDEPIAYPLSMESLLDAKYSTYNLSTNSGSTAYMSTINIYTQYITVPLTFNYTVIDHRFNLSLGGGFATDFFLQYKSKEDKKNNVEKEQIKYYDNSIFKNIGFSLLINADLEYELSHKYSIYLRPLYKGSLHSYTDQNKLKNRPNSTGITFGIRYNFK